MCTAQREYLVDRRHVLEDRGRITADTAGESTRGSVGEEFGTVITF